MKPDILKLAKQFSEQTNDLNGEALEKFAGAKERLSRNKMQKALEKAKLEHKRLKENLDYLEVNDRKLKEQLEKTRSAHSDARSRILQLHKGLQHMDLANADDAVFYDDDIGYVIKGKEYHLDVDDVGDLRLTPMNKWRKAQKEDKANMADEGRVEDPNLVNDQDTHDEEKELYDYLNGDQDE